jgi:hypothetical protein
MSSSSDDDDDFFIFWSRRTANKWVLLANKLVVLGLLGEMPALSHIRDNLAGGPLTPAASATALDAVRRVQQIAPIGTVVQPMLQYCLRHLRDLFVRQCCMSDTGWRSREAMEQQWEDCFQRPLERNLHSQLAKSFAEITCDVDDAYKSVNSQKKKRPPRPSRRRRITTSDTVSSGWCPVLVAGAALAAASAISLRRVAQRHE